VERSYPVPVPAPSRLAAVRREAAATARLAAPLVGGQLAGVGLHFIDTVMAGQLDARALAAVAVGASVWSSVNVFCLGVLLAIPPAVARLDGAGDRPAVAPFARQAFWVSLGLSALAIAAVSNVRPLLELVRVEPAIVPTVTAYLAALTWGVPAWFVYLLLRFLSDGLHASRPGLYFGLLGLPVNVAANYVLMYGKLGFPALGAVGLGYATAVVWWAQGLALLAYVALHPRYRALGLFARLEPPRRGEIAGLLRVGVPIGVAVFVEVGMFAAVALAIGSLGTAPVAGHQVALNFVAVTFMVPLGIAMAVTVRVGHAVGRGDPGAVRVAAFVGGAMAMLCQAASAGVMLLFPRQVAAIYTDDGAVIAVARDLLVLAAVFQLSDGLQVSAAGALRGLADTRVTMLVTVVAYWLVGVPLGWLLGFPLGLGARGLWMGLIAGLTLGAALLAARFLRVSRAAGERGAPAR
jgi:MATE family multidrug resistance protein